MNRPVFRTSNGTLMQTTDSLTTDHRPPPFGWDERIHGKWWTTEQNDDDDDDADAKSLSETMTKLDHALDELAAALEEREAARSNARLRRRFGLEPDQPSTDRLADLIFGGDR